MLDSTFLPGPLQYHVDISSVLVLQLRYQTLLASFILHIGFGLHPATTKLRERDVRDRGVVRRQLVRVHFGLRALCTRKTGCKGGNAVFASLSFSLVPCILNSWFFWKMVCSLSQLMVTMYNRRHQLMPEVTKRSTPCILMRIVTQNVANAAHF